MWCVSVVCICDVSSFLQLVSVWSLQVCVMMLCQQEYGLCGSAWRWNLPVYVLQLSVVVTCGHEVWVVTERLFPVRASGLRDRLRNSESHCYFMLKGSSWGCSTSEQDPPDAHRRFSGSNWSVTQGRPALSGGIIYPIRLKILQHEQKTVLCR